jgi:hypothetical protein
MLELYRSARDRQARMLGHNLVGRHVMRLCGHECGDEGEDMVVVERMMN